MQPIFLDWNRPFLPVAAEYLIEKFARDGKLDLRHVVLALPGRRAINRLEELLAEKVEQFAKAGKLDSAWYPPEFLTLGTLPEKFYELKKPIADDLTQRFAWLNAIDQLEDENPDMLKQVLPFPPPPNDLDARLALGKMFATIHRELAADALDFSKVAQICRKKKIEKEAERWNALAKLQEKYHQLLDSLDIWDVQTARLFAINKQQPEEFKRIYDMLKENGIRFFLLGLVDMNTAQKDILEKFEDFVTPIVFAPESFEEKFDKFGCLNPDVWVNESIEIKDAQIEVVERPEHQANAVLRKIAKFEGRYSAHEIIVGVPDRQIIPFIEQRLEQAGITSRQFEGIPMKQTAVYRFLEVVQKFLESQTFAPFAELVRHPDVEAFLHNDKILDQEDLLSALDYYYTEFLPVAIGNVWQSKIGMETPLPKDGENIPKSHKLIELLPTIWNQLMELLDAVLETPNRKPNDKFQPFIWTQKIEAMLDRLYAETSRLSEFQKRLIDEVRKQVHAAVETLNEIPHKICPKVSLSETIRLILTQIESGNIPPHGEPDAIELLGWLEIVMDDASAVLVTGMNDGFVPSYLTSDIFLPDKVRQELGIEDNKRRFARDAYSLSAILKTRPQSDTVHLIGGRFSTEGDPMLPSRLFFATKNVKVIADRVKNYFEDIKKKQKEPEIYFDGMSQPGQMKESTFQRPPAEKLNKLKSIRVTEFADYLQCPYRYYLKHRLRLDNLRDNDEELNARSFGTLIHEVLKRFGQNEARDSTSPETISKTLNRELDDFVMKNYGKNLRPVIAIQVERAKKRLESFAHWQAKWAVDHSIFETEKEFDDIFLKVPEGEILLRGRIDRIDCEKTTGKRIVLDYKTTDNAPTPEKKHRKRDRDGELQWIDLQLPLYHYILRQSGYAGEIDLGYITLPKTVSTTDSRLDKIAEWSSTDIQEAIAKAEEVVSDILNGQFEPPTTPPPPYSEVFTAICLD